MKKDESERRIENERESDEKEDGAFDLRNRSLNQIYWVIELCGGMTPQVSFFSNKLLIIPPETVDCQHNWEFANCMVILREHIGYIVFRVIPLKKIIYKILLKWWDSCIIWLHNFQYVREVKGIKAVRESIYNYICYDEVMKFHR